MSHELFEVFGILGIGVGLTALFHRALQTLLLRATSNAKAAPQRAARRPAVAASFAAADGAEHPDFTL